MKGQKLIAAGLLAGFLGTQALTGAAMAQIVRQGETRNVPSSSRYPYNYHYSGNPNVYTRYGYPYSNRYYYSDGYRYQVDDDDDFDQGAQIGLALLGGALLGAALSSANAPVQPAVPAPTPAPEGERVSIFNYETRQYDYYIRRANGDLIKVDKDVFPGQASF